jgi:hypothetical protein
MMPWLLGKGFVSACRVIVVAEKCCCLAHNERKDVRTKATNSYVHLVELKLFSSIELLELCRTLKN